MILHHSPRPGRGCPGTARRTRLALEPIESRILPASQPVASLVVPPSPLIGESATFSVGFRNASPTDTGYAPFLDLTLPATGIDGDDGIAFRSATYLGTPLAATVLTFDAAGVVLHPLARDSAGAPVVVRGAPGDQLVVLALPFGSFTPGQPEAVVQVVTSVSNKADVGASLPVQTQAGFALGDSPQDDPANDPSILGPALNDQSTPVLMRLTKAYIGPEGETATGPTFPREYLLTLDVADGQTLTDVDLTDLLPANLQFAGVVETLVHGVPVSTTPISTPSTTSPGGTLTRRFAAVVGDPSIDDLSMLFRFYVPEKDADGLPVLKPGIGLPTTSLDAADARGEWTPIDSHDPPGIYASNTATHTLTDRSIAFQKAVVDVIPTGAAGTISPGDTLEYTINFQVSDFFAFQDLVVGDLVSDGQLLDPNFVPTLLYHGNGFSLPTANFHDGNYSTTPLPDGSSRLSLRVSDEMVARGRNGQLVGGMVNPSGGSLPFPGQGPITGVLSFRTVIQKTFAATPAPGAVVGQGDRLNDSITATAAVLDNATLRPTGNSVTDDSHAEVVISSGSLEKTIYAINGDTGVPGNPHVKPGDAVTYQLHYSLPNSNFNDLILDDFLPLPIFAATSVTAFQSIVSAASPPVGTAWFGPGDTFFNLSGLSPSLSTDAVSNRVRFDWPQYINPGNVTSFVEVLFTVQVSSQPFADQLLLTNQARSTETTTNNRPIVDTQIVQLILKEPSLTMTKAVVATDDPLAQFTGPRGPVTFLTPPASPIAFVPSITSAGLAARPLDSNLVQAQGATWSRSRS
ncbi:MAG: hypothetical protein U0800_05995 [Isosphaeraceae bacterium]